MNTFITEYPVMKPTFFELLDSYRSKYLQLLREEKPNEEELAFCQSAIQYYLAEVVAERRAEKTKSSFATFFRSAFMRFMPFSKMNQPTVS